MLVKSCKRSGLMHAMKTKKPWQTPLREYLGASSVRVSDPSVERDGPEYLRRNFRDISDWDEMKVSERQDVRFRSNGQGLIAAFDSETGELLGGGHHILSFRLPPAPGAQS